MPRDLVEPYVITTADIAAAYAQQGEMEKACEMLNEALDLAAPAGLITGRVSHVVGIRQRYLSGNTPVVGVLDESTADVGVRSGSSRDDATGRRRYEGSAPACGDMGTGILLPGGVGCDRTGRV
jgi:hypothetical protein